jgi:hypothetical protein
MRRHIDEGICRPAEYGVAACLLCYFDHCTFLFPNSLTNVCGSSYIRLLLLFCFALLFAI